MNRKTEGTFKAEVTRADGSTEHYAGDERWMQLYYWEGVLTLSSRQLIDQERQIFRNIYIDLPDDGDVQNKVYRVQTECLPTTGSGLAFASWAISEGSNFSPFGGFTGAVTLTIDTTTQTASGSFEFEGKGSIPGAPSSEVVTVQSGNFILKGLDEGRFKEFLPSNKNYSVSDSFTANITGDINRGYEANRFSLDWRPDSVGAGVKGPHWRGWSSYVDESSTPETTVDIISVSISDDLVPDTYDLEKHRDKIFALYIEYDGIHAYPAVSGTLTINTSPPKGSSAGVLEGVIHFEAKLSDGSKTINVENGVFHFDGIQRPA
ncbi:hypothetical protein [Pseudomonas sp.]|uniref:hypothetical protein n=1 Tax=Pseudomonas sp. TaxID=306 RepID=UPI003F41512D